MYNIRKHNATITFNPKIEEIISSIIYNRGKVYLVGGSVRDIVLHTTPKDFDFEVFGMEHETLAKLLNCEMTGNAFGVFNLIIDDIEVQFSIPRTEVKTGTGYKGFTTTLDPNLSLKDAAMRRDFTMNAMYIDMQDRQYIIDYTGGLSAIDYSIIEPVSDKTFYDDPVRLLRVIQLAGRTGFEFIGVYEHFYNAAIKLNYELNNEPSERILIELEKLLNKSVSDMGFIYLEALLNTKWFSFILDMIETEHCQINHREGNVWIHTQCVISQLLELRNKAIDVNLETMYAALFHDWGKKNTSKVKTIVNGKKRITAIGHEIESVKLFNEYLDKLHPNFDRQLRRTISLLIENHMVNADTVKYLSVIHGNEFGKQLCLLIIADNLGRLPSNTIVANEMFEVYQQLKENPIERIVTGKTLIQYGYKPSEMFGKWLSILLKMQIKRTLTHSNIDKCISSVCGKVEK